MAGYPAESASLPCAAIPSGYIGNLDEAQKTALKELKGKLQSFAQDQECSTDSTAKKENAGPTDPIQPGTPAEEAAEARLLLSSDADMLRFLRARNFDVAKTTSMAVSTCKWRASVKPQAITPEMLPHALPSSTMVLAGHAKSGMPIITFDSAKWKPSAYNDMDEMIRYVAYFLDGAVARMAPGVEKFFILFHLGGFSRENLKPFATKCVLQLISITQNHYPERLGVAINVKAPWIYEPLWKIICPFIDEKTRQKVGFVKEIPSDTLLELVDENVLVAEYGGTHAAYPLCTRSLHDETEAYYMEIGGREKLPAHCDVRGLTGIDGVSQSNELSFVEDEQ